MRYAAKDYFWGTERQGFTTVFAETVIPVHTHTPAALAAFSSGQAEIVLHPFALRSNFPVS
jgi:hypothetical protein